MKPEPSPIDLAAMNAALEEARIALAEGNLPIGAVVVHEGVSVATGRNGIESGEDDTRHAEPAAIQAIPQFLFRHKRQCTVYTTLEPCMMCMGAIVNTGITRVVYGVRDPVWRMADVLPTIDYTRRKKMELIEGVLRKESQALLEEQVRRNGARAHIASPGLQLEGQLALLMPPLAG